MRATARGGGGDARIMVVGRPGSRDLNLFSLLLLALGSSYALVSLVAQQPAGCRSHIMGIRILEATVPTVIYEVPVYEEGRVNSPPANRSPLHKFFMYGLHGDDIVDGGAPLT